MESGKSDHHETGTSKSDSIDLSIDKIEEYKSKPKFPYSTGPRDYQKEASL